MLSADCPAQPGLTREAYDAMLPDWVAERGRAAGCQSAMLDAYVQNGGAHRFYFREGYTILGFHMTRVLDP